MNYLYFEVLPRLKAGVYIHVHDIFDGFTPHATRLGRRHKAEAAVRAENPHGEAVWWVGAAGPAADDGPGTDFHAVASGYVSVTPLQIDLTHFEKVTHVRDWLGR